MLLHGPSTFRINSTERIAWAQDLSQRAPSMLLYGPSTFTIISRFPLMALVMARIVSVGAPDTLAWPSASKINSTEHIAWAQDLSQQAPSMLLYGPSTFTIISRFPPMTSVRPRIVSASAPSALAWAQHIQN